MTDRLHLTTAELLALPKAKAPRKRKGPTWDETRDTTRVEQREYTVLSRTDRVGRSSVDIRCPFCSTVVMAFIWSLCGGGKRCDCGAMFGSIGGVAYHWKDRT